MVEIYDNVIGDVVCDQLIEILDSKIESSEATPIVKSWKGGLDVDIFDQFELEQYSEISDYLTSIVKSVGSNYLEKYDPKQFLPTKVELEQFRVKRYEPNEQMFPWHIDSGNLRHSKRFLSFLFYLNDNEAGTEFEDFTVEAKKGRVVVFPPLWMFPHQGTMPTKTPKYIMSTYYHYAESD